MRGFKDLAVSRIPQDHPLREVILAEKDEIEVEEFLLKLEVWLNLAGYGRG